MNETIQRIFNSPDDFLFSAKFLCENLQDVLLTLEKEIPNDDALDTVEQIYMSFGDNEIEEAVDMLNQYAESYNKQKRDTTTHMKPFVRFENRSSTTTDVDQ